jgi:hypothetical protein
VPQTMYTHVSKCKNDKIRERKKKIGVVEWLKVKAPSSSPSTEKKVYFICLVQFLSVYLIRFLLGLPVTRVYKNVANHTGLGNVTLSIFNLNAWLIFYCCWIINLYLTCMPIL